MRGTNGYIKKQRLIMTAILRKVKWYFSSDLRQRREEYHASIQNIRKEIKGYDEMKNINASLNDN